MSKVITMFCPYKKIVRYKINPTSAMVTLMEEEFTECHGENCRVFVNGTCNKGKEE